MTELESLEPRATIESEPATAYVISTRSLEHRDLRRDEFWRGIPGYAAVPGAEFHTHTFQSRHTVTNVRQLHEALGSLVPDSFYQDVTAGLKRAPMALRISPYLLSLVDW